jgi:hypothetical protein
MGDPMELALAWHLPESGDEVHCGKNGGVGPALLVYEGDQFTWTNLKPRFQRQFAIQTDKKSM